jgi:hypothetical protein
MDENRELHIICTSQVHTCSNFSDKQIESVSQSLSASANYLRKLVEGDTKKSASEEANVPKEAMQAEDTTVSVHADASYKDTLVGFTLFDSRDVDTASYSVKRQAYDNVRKKYPDVDNLIRDEKVKALKELKSVGFRYYSITVTALIVKDGLTRKVHSKSHHRLEKPSKEYLEMILADTFNGRVRDDSKKNHGQPVDTAGDGSPNVE